MEHGFGIRPDPKLYGVKRKPKKVNFLRVETRHSVDKTFYLPSRNLNGTDLWPDFSYIARKPGKGAKIYGKTVKRNLV